MSMKVLRIPVYWTAEEADSIYQLLCELKEEVWRLYGEEIGQLHADLQSDTETDTDFNDDLPF
jgi:hypothetical protein